MLLLPGSILHKRYRIVSLLAESGYGATYRARDVESGADVAVKEYLDSSPEIQKLFRREARRLSELAHPQLPDVLDHFSLEGIGQYLVSSYVDGVDLQSLVAQYGVLPSDLIIGWLQAVCVPLAYLHKNDRLHLNIKPANIRVAPSGEVFLVDTGLPGLGIRPHVAGYGSPEQQGQTAVSPASDIYSLGATLYVLLTTEVPPNALSRESGLSDLKPAREVNPDVEPYLSLVASRAMSIRPDARYESAADFAQALNRPTGHLDTAVTESRRTAKTQFGQPAPSPKWTPRHRRKMETRTILALAAILILLVGLGVVLTLFNVNDPAVTEQEATATLESAVVAALTAIAPTPSPLPVPTEPPTPTPEPILTESGVRMLYVPGGQFRMGDEEGERDERPSHIVRLDPYYIDETEVTNGQYQQCVDAGGCAPPSRSNPTTHPAYYGDPAFADYPVVFVNWRQADAFCQWRGARLPSEAEWEMAAGFDPEQVVIFRYPWGDAFDGTKLNFCDKNCPGGDSAWNDGHKDTAPVGSYPDGRSPIGAYDMSGNVMEWVSDWYDSRYYETTTDVNPMGPPEGAIKSLRGGSWLSSAEEVHISARGSFEPAVVQANLGFRCAMTAP